MNNVAFLLGAGASIPAGFSKTDDITEGVRKPFRRKMGHSYRPSVVDWLIQRLYALTVEYYSARRDETKKVNYEDVYYLASQIADDQTELQNPALMPLLVRLRHELGANREYQRYCDQIQTSTLQDDLSVFCSAVCSRIADVVRNVLSQKAQGANKHLELIQAVHGADDLHLRGIGTLAHDTHVELHLLSSGVELSDGFGRPDPANDLRLWRNCFPDGKVPFVKLHGSVNWFWLKGWPDGDGPMSAIGMKDGVGIQHGDIRPVGDGPEFIHGGAYMVTGGSIVIGTFNKPAQYSRSIMLDSHYRFRRILSETTTLVVCGYSFGDKAINAHIVDWHGDDRNLVVVDFRDRFSVIRTARYAACKILVEPTTQFIQKPMEMVDPRELLEKLRTRCVQPKAGRRYVIEAVSKDWKWPLAQSHRVYMSPQAAVEAAVLCNFGLPKGKCIVECPPGPIAEFVAFPENESESKTYFWIA